MMTCPYCHYQVSAFPREPREGGGEQLRCPNATCKRIIPWEYVTDYETHPPLLFSMIGMTSHGKTTFMEAFKLGLDEIGQTWPGFSKTARTVPSFRQGQETRATAGRKKIDPDFITLNRVPRVGNCQLMMYDTGGENFDNVNHIIQFVQYTRHSQCIVWLIGLVNKVELELPPGKEPRDVLIPVAGTDVVVHDPPQAMGLAPITEDGRRRVLYELGREKLDSILANYRTAMLSQSSDLKNQSLIVILTKGDYLNLIFDDFPKEASEFLDNDDLDPAGDAWDRLEVLSQRLERWLVDLGYYNFVNNARQHFRDVHYCVSSAYAPSMELLPTPRGVLAPLFWLWRLQRSPVWLEGDSDRQLFFSLHDALNHAKPGSVLRLEPGRYVLDRPWRIDRPIEIAGALEGQTTIELRVASGDAMRIETDGHVVLTDLQFEHTGTTPLQSLVHVPRGKLTVIGSRFAGALAANGAPLVKAGILLRQGAWGEFTDCEFRSAQVGLAIAENSSGTVTQSTFQHHSHIGIMVRDRAQARIDRNRIVGTALGVHCGSTVESIVVDNEIWKGFVGIRLAAGVARLQDNRIHDNSKEGIRLDDATANCLRNVVMKNDRGGFIISGSSDGEIQENQVLNNRTDGIRVKDASRLRLFKNEIARNDGAGIAIRDHAAPQCIENSCHHNKGDGIHVEAEATPSLRGNSCESNGGDGIAIADAARPSLERNTLVSNSGFGLRIASTTKPSGVRSNTLRDNRKGDKSDQRSYW